MTRTRLALLLPAVLLPAALLTGCGDKDDDDATGPVDADGDGHDAAVDCDDADDSIHPGATEVCNGVDDDCDDAVDDDDPDVDLTGAPTWYADVDFDGFGDPDAPVQACAQPASTTADATDCNDADDAVNPAADEQCNGVDDDCDDEIDEDATGLSSWWADADGDGYGDPTTESRACAQPADHVDNDDDCDDTDGAVFPGATERCNDADDDCSTATDEAGVASFQAADGTWTDWTDDMSGGSARAAEVSIDDPGTLHVCEGTWYTTIDVFADVAIVGHGDVTLDAAADGAVVEVGADGVALTLEGLTLQGGVSEGSSAFGEAAGGVSCETEGSTLGLSDVRLTGNDGGWGGGLTSYLCDVELSDVVVDRNTAELGGGAVVWLADLAMADSTVSYNLAEEVGGVLLWSSGDHSWSLSEVELVGNEDVRSAGGLQAYAGDLDWTGGQASLNRSESGPGGVAVWSAGDTRARFEGVDFGEDGADDDNDPFDVEGDGVPYLAGDDASFSCVEGGCGTPSTSSIGSDDGSVGLMNRAYGSFITAERTVTLTGLEFYVSGVDTCVLDAYLLQGDGGSEWTVAWSSLDLSVSSRPTWLDAGAPDMLLREGRTYAFVLGARCSGSSGATFYYAGESGEGDADFGSTLGYAYASSYTGVLSGSATLYTSETADLAFATRFELGTL